MTPEEKALLENTARKLDEFLEVFYRSNYPDKVIYRKELVVNDKLTLGDGVNIPVGATTGTKIGTSATQKLAVFNATPVVQAGAISAPSSPSASYSQAEAQSVVTAVNSLITVIKNFGITA